MKYQCENCSHTFTAREAICEDWREREKSFICPACECCLEKPDSFPATATEWILRIFDAVATWVILGFALGLISQIIELLVGDGSVAAVIFFLVLLAGGTLLAIKYLGKPLLARPIESKGL